jgi:hypothetical protein
MEQVEVDEAVGIGFEDALARIAALCDMMRDIDCDNASESGHKRRCKGAAKILRKRSVCPRFPRPPGSPVPGLFSPEGSSSNHFPDRCTSRTREPTCTALPLRSLVIPLLLPRLSMGAPTNGLSCDQSPLRLHHPIAGEVVSEADLPQARGGHHSAEPRLVLCVEQEEPAASGANQFAA